MDDKPEIGISNDGKDRAIASKQSPMDAQKVNRDIYKKPVGEVEKMEQTHIMANSKKTKVYETRTYKNGVKKTRLVQIKKA